MRTMFPIILAPELLQPFAGAQIENRCGKESDGRNHKNDVSHLVFPFSYNYAQIKRRAKKG